MEVGQTLTMQFGRAAGTETDSVHVSEAGEMCMKLITSFIEVERLFLPTAM